ncbi:MAG: hypothetical protein GY854_14595 [Deltaproteobacteria bacterium]|nr:hypothetical protein [Deltaproteobacteria bacterium]
MKRLARTALSLWMMLMALGCAPSIAQLERHLDANRFDRAVETAADSPAMQVELAALILERAAKDEARTSEMITILKGAGKPGKRALQRLVDDSEDGVVRQAEVALHRYSPPEGKDLALYLEHDSSDVRERAARKWYSEMDAATLEMLLVDRDPRVRRWAAKGLCRFNGAHGTDALLRDALRLDPDSKVRAEAARCGKCLGRDALLVLKAALDDKNLGVRLAVIQGLSETGDENALTIVEERAAGPIDEMTVAAAAELSRLGNPLGKERLDAALESDRPVIRQAALLRLERARVQDRDAIFVRMLGDEAPGVVLLVAGLLSSREEINPAVPNALRRLVEEAGSYSEKARDQLAVLGDQNALEQVAKALDDAEEATLLTVLTRVRRAVGLAHRFVKLMGNESESIRIAAARATLATVR